MPVYQPGIPTGTVNLDVDYLNLQGNFTQANIVYGTDHYPFDNATPNQGFHNVVTTPVVVNNPPDGLPPATAAGICKFYSFQQYSAIGPLQWSRGPSNAIPTPLTSLNGGPFNMPTLTNSPTIIDFAGFNKVIAVLTGFNDAPASADKKPMNSLIVFSQGTSNLGTTVSPGSMGAIMTGTQLAIRNQTATTAGAYYYNLRFLRLE